MTQASALTKPRLIQLIHVAKSQLQLDDATYRAILQRVGNQSSCADLPVPKLKQVLDAMKRGGFVVRSKNRPTGRGKVSAATKPALSRALAGDPESKKIRALWLFLVQMGVVKNSDEAALAAYAKRITKVEALQWLRREQAQVLIESLKKWAMRFLPGQVRAMAEQLSVAVRAGNSLPAEQTRRLNTLLSEAFARHTFDPMQEAWAALRAALDAR